MADTTALLERLENLDKETHREFFQLKDLEFVNNEEGKNIRIGDNMVGLSKDSFSSLCNTLEIPALYANRCPAEEQSRMVNYWLRQRKDIMHSALITDGKVRTFMESNYTYVPTNKIINTVLNMIPDDFIVGNYSLKPDALEAQIFTPEFTQHVVDSEIRGGLRIVYSDSWAMTPKFDTYLYRVMCTNGLVSPLAGKKFRIAGKSEEELLSQVREYIKTSLEQMPTMFQGFLDLEEQKVENWIATVRKIILENKLPKKLADILIMTADTVEFKMTIRGRIESMHDIVNLITYVGTHNREISDAHREALMEIAGHMTVHSAARCYGCGSKV